ncbi:MAG: sulfite exporter TauE/SafE family protein [Proteobacteria bacterium]|nr:sulfite exporter TauE/SafE family protein [Pseudomonadota bacterium]
MIPALLIGLGFAAWFLSSLAAGGGAVLFLPVARFALAPQDVPPVIAVASVVSSVQRCFLYRRDISRPILFHNVPGLALGALVGAFALRGLRADGLTLVVAGFLVVLSVLHFAPVRVSLPAARPIHFGLSSFATASLSAVVGAAGPLMNPVYLAAGVVKEQMIGTKAASTLFMQVAKLVAYASLGLLTPSVLLAGALVGAGALAGNAAGKAALARLSVARFTDLVHLALLASGIAMAWNTF